MTVVAAEVLVLLLVEGLLELPVVVALVAAGAEVGAVGLWVLNDSSITSPAAVLAMAAMTRRTGVLLVGQNSKDSWWSCRRGTPAARRACLAAVVMPGGPQR